MKGTYRPNVTTRKAKRKWTKNATRQFIPGVSIDMANPKPVPVDWSTVIVAATSVAAIVATTAVVILK
jgi:hypothetical protein